MGLEMLLPTQDLKAILFDLDNVLVFSEVMHFNSWKMVMEQVGVNPELLDFQSLIGVSDSQQAVILQNRFSINVDPTDIWKMKRKAFFTLIPNGFESPHGREPFLTWVSENFISAVVSSSGNQVIKEVLEADKIAHHFDFIIGHEDCIRHKPDPLPYLLALEKCNLKSHQALVIEDSPSGITAALEAEIPVVGIFKDQTPDQLIPNVKYFNSFSEIHVWLNEQHSLPLQAAVRTD